LKLSVALQVSWLALLGPFSSAVANPAFVLMAESFHQGVVETSYGKIGAGHQKVVLIRPF
jgi:RNase P/RNase MRP subunit POP5